MKGDDSPSRSRGFSLYVAGFLIILLFWSLAGPFVSLFLLEILHSRHLASSTFHLYVTQHINFIILLLCELLFIRFALHVRVRDFLSDVPEALSRQFLLGGGSGLLR